MSPGGPPDAHAKGFAESLVRGTLANRAAIDAKLRRTDASVYRIRVIHGYRGGTVLRDAVRTHYMDHPKVKRIGTGLDPGRTDLILREL